MQSSPPLTAKEKKNVYSIHETKERGKENSSTASIQFQNQFQQKLKYKGTYPKQKIKTKI